MDQEQEIRELRTAMSDAVTGRNAYRELSVERMAKPRCFSRDERLPNCDTLTQRDIDRLVARRFNSDEEV